MNTIKEELRAWMRPMSPLTAFARSLRNEGEQQQDDPSKAAKGVEINNDPFKDIDFDELPEATRTAMIAAKAKFEETTKSNTNLESRRKQAEDFARTQQSRADRATATLQAHNLPVDGTKPPVANSADTKHATLVAQFVKDGLKPEVAETYAKMFASAGQVERESLMRELAPLGAAVGSIQATQVLNQAEGDYKQVFAVKELADQIRANVAALVSQGNPVDKNTVDHLVSMAWGNYTLKNPDAMKTQQQQQVPQFGNPMPVGGHVSRVNDPATGAPVATQPETIKIVSELNRYLRADMPKKK